MLSYIAALAQLTAALQPLYDEREAGAIADSLLLHVSGKTRLQRQFCKEEAMPQREEQQFMDAMPRLVAGVPLQYVTGEAWFYERPFYVDNNVLIPRPETEELVQWIIKDQGPNSKFQIPTILDIGTGSGCIPVTLKLVIPGAQVAACDISEGALAVARRNAEALKSEVTFIQLDILDEAAYNKLGSYDVIVSNPPYIPEVDKTSIHANVKDHEPSIALFVPDTDALLFYKAIAKVGRAHLNSGGYIYCELDPAHADACKALFEREGYSNVEIRKDMHGNWRMLRAQKVAQ
ncbi:MAG: peptide chain release factor N(5)-glutamine methyltransferase [Bacteroidota bacterium]